jgi:hypothetical protein
VPGHLTRQRLLPAILVVIAAAAPYLPTLDDYFVQDDFGVVSLLSGKPASYFPRWFVSTWMDYIWGFTPDEIRPFPALSFQIAAAWDPAWPVPNHVITVIFHAVNALLVLAIAWRAAGLSLPAATLAAVVFAILPMQTESVAWITGRVDSMPACFYLAAFLLYARWRAEHRRRLYGWSVVMCFVALFTKQNTITLAPALVLYDAVVGRVRPRASWHWLRPYVPFVLLTLGYMYLRFVLFGEVAREGMLTGERVGLFLGDLSVHLRRMVFGAPGLRMSGARAATYGVLASAAVVAIALARGGPQTTRVLRPAIYFSIVWLGLAIAPTLVAGYASPRHMYLASSAWAIAIGIAFEVLLSSGRPATMQRRAAIVLVAAMLAFYGFQLAREIQAWHTRSEVSRRAVADIEREALAAPPGSLLIAGAPRRSWEFALPHALRPPFTSADLTGRVSVISDPSLHCCPAHQWEAYTRGALRAWITDPKRPPVIALYWDPDTGTLARLTEREEPFLRPMMTVFLETGDAAALERAIQDMLSQLVAGRGRRPPQTLG